MFDDVQSEVVVKATPQEGASHMLRRVLDRIEAALNGNEWNKARALINDARSRADAFADAIMHKGEGSVAAQVGDMVNADDAAQEVREDAQRLSQGAVSGVVGGEPGMVVDQGEGGDTGRPGWMAGEAGGDGPRRVGKGWVG